MDTVTSSRPTQIVPPPAANVSYPPPPGSAHLMRSVFYPYGKGGLPSFTLSLYPTGIPAPNGADYLGFRLYQHNTPGKDSKAVYEGVELAGDLPATMLGIVHKIVEAPPVTIAQADFRAMHAIALLRSVQKRFGWVEDTKAMRVPLEVVHRKQRGRHAFAIGELVGVGPTRFAAKADFEGAVAAHLRMGPPRFQVGGVTGSVYAWYAHGSDVVLQVINPRDASAPMGDQARFRASSPTEANEVAETLIAQAERDARSSGRSAAPPSLRPAARAGSLHVSAARA